jgi:hypothetical protein
MVLLPGQACPMCGERPYSVYANSVAGEAPLWPLGARVEMARERAVAHRSYDGGLREPVPLLKPDGMRPEANGLGWMSAEARPELGASFEQTEILGVPAVAQEEARFNRAEWIKRGALQFQVSAGSRRSGRRRLWEGRFQA